MQSAGRVIQHILKVTHKRAARGQSLMLWYEVQGPKNWYWVKIKKINVRKLNLNENDCFVEAAESMVYCTF